MTKLLEEAIHRLRQLPTPMQDSAARAVLTQLEEDPSPVIVRLLLRVGAISKMGTLPRLINCGMKWGLVIGSRAKRQFRRIPSDDRRAIDAAFSEMCAAPFEGDVKALRGLDSFRRRVGNWRILFELMESQKLIIVTAIKRRGSSTY